MTLLSLSRTLNITPITSGSDKTGSLTMHAFPVFVVYSGLILMCQCVDKEMYNSKYSCCENPKISVEEHCENTFRKNGEAFAIYNDGVAKNCESPCRKIEGGEMLMHECANVTQDVVCKNGTRVTVDKEIHYHGQPCHRLTSDKMDPGSHGVWLAVGIVLLVLL